MKRLMFLMSVALFLWAASAFALVYPERGVFWCFEEAVSTVGDREATVRGWWRVEVWADSGNPELLFGEFHMRRQFYFADGQVVNDGFGFGLSDIDVLSDTSFAFDRDGMRYVVDMSAAGVMLLTVDGTDGSGLEFHLECIGHPQAEEPEITTPVATTEGGGGCSLGGNSLWLLLVPVGMLVGRGWR